MTNEEAISILDELGGTCSNDIIYVACHMAIEALEKQIPKKPRKQVISVYASKATEVLCPVCNKSICTWITLDSHSKKKPFCPNCSQALDWGAEE